MENALKTENGKQFIAQLRCDYPQFKFRPGRQDHWSPKTGTITYNQRETSKQLKYGVLHELAHALLDHTTYNNDFELLQLETLAWELAAKLGRRYGLKIDEEHVQNCLDTYRDWLHKRSLCPTCGMHVIQHTPHAYKCFNCQSIWHVSSGRFVRPYRLTKFKEQ